MKKWLFILINSMFLFCPVLLAQSNKIAIVIDENIFEGNWPKELASYGVYPTSDFDIKTLKFYNKGSLELDMALGELIKNKNVELFFIPKSSKKIKFVKNIPIENHIVVTNNKLLSNGYRVKKIYTDFKPYILSAKRDHLTKDEEGKVKKIISAENNSANDNAVKVAKELELLSFFLTGIDSENGSIALKFFSKLSSERKAKLLTEKIFKWKLNKSQQIIGCVLDEDLNFDIKTCEAELGVVKSINIEKHLCTFWGKYKNKKYFYKDLDFNECFNKTELMYVWKNYLKNECIQIYQDKIIRTVNRNKCENVSPDSYIECPLRELDFFSIGKILKLKDQVDNLGPKELLTNEIRNYFKDDRDGIKLFLQNLFDDFYVPCLLNNKDLKDKFEFCNKLVNDQTSNLLTTIKSDRQLIEKIKKFYKENLLITLKRNMMGYHYTNYNFRLKDGVTNEYAKKIALNYVKYISSQADRVDQEVNDAAGPGLYFAIDPKASEEYGDNLIRLEFFKGQKFLDIRNLSIDLPDAIYKAVIEKCNGVIRNRSTHIHGLKHHCHKIFDPVFKELGIDGLIYTYKTNLKCDGPNADYAIVNWNSNIKIEDIEILDKSIINDEKIDPNWTKLEKEYFEEYKAFDAKEASKDQKEIISKRRKNAYGCDLKLHPNESVKKTRKLIGVLNQW